MADTFSANFNFILPEIGGSPDTWGDKLNQNFSELDAIMRRLLPVGMITMWSGTEVPSGWALCNGSNGTPDLRNRFVVGAGGSYSVGATGGANSVTLTTGQIPAHNHSASTGSAGGHSHTASTGSAGDHTHGGSTGNAGGHSHSASTATAGGHSHTGSTNSTGSHSHSGSTNSTGAHTHPLAAWGRATFATGSFNQAGVRFSSANGSNAGGMGWRTGDTSHYRASSAGAHSHSLSINSAGAHSHTLSIDSAGGHSHTVTVDSVGNHNHSLTVNSAGAHTHDVTVNSVSAHNHTVSVSNTGGGQSHENRPPYYALAYIMLLPEVE